MLKDLTFNTAMQPSRQNWYLQQSMPPMSDTDLQTFLRLAHLYL